MVRATVSFNLKAEHSKFIIKRNNRKWININDAEKYRQVIDKILQDPDPISMEALNGKIGKSINSRGSFVKKS